MKDAEAKVAASEGAQPDAFEDQTSSERMIFWSLFFFGSSF